MITFIMIALLVLAIGLVFALGWLSVLSEVLGEAEETLEKQEKKIENNLQYSITRLKDKVRELEYPTVNYLVNRRELLELRKEIDTNIRKVNRLIDESNLIMEDKDKLELVWQRTKINKLHKDSIEDINSNLADLDHKKEK